MKDDIRKTLKLFEEKSGNSKSDFISELKNTLDDWDSDNAEGASRHSVIDSIRKLLDDYNY